MAGEYSLTDLLERMYENQLALEAALCNWRSKAKNKDRQRLAITYVALYS